MKRPLDYTSIKHAMDVCDGKQYLSKNDIEGFYRSIYENIGDLMTSSEITMFLIENGVDPIKYVKTKIPYAMFFSETVPNDLIKNKVLILPNNIKTIEDYAFAKADGFDGVDLRGIEFVRRGAFNAASCNYIITDGSYKQIDRLAFKYCDIKTVYVDDSKYDFEEIKQLLLWYIEWENEPHFERI